MSWYVNMKSNMESYRYNLHMFKASEICSEILACLAKFSGGGLKSKCPKGNWTLEDM